MSKWIKFRLFIVTSTVGVGTFAEIFGINGAMNTGLMIMLGLWVMADDIEQDDEGYHLAA